MTSDIDTKTTTATVAVTVGLNVNELNNDNDDDGNDVFRNFVKEEESRKAIPGGEGGDKGDIATATETVRAKTAAADGGSNSDNSVGMLHFVKKLLPQSSHTFRKKGRKRKTASQIVSSFANDDDHDDDSRKMQRLLPTSLLELAGKSTSSGPPDSDNVGSEDGDLNDINNLEKSKKFDDNDKFDVNINGKEGETEHQLQQQQASSNQQHQQLQHHALHQQLELELQHQRLNSQQQLHHRFHSSNDGDREIVQHDQTDSNLKPNDGEIRSGDNDGDSDSDRNEAFPDNSSTIITTGDELVEGGERSTDQGSVAIANLEHHHHPSQQQEEQQFRQSQPMQIQMQTKIQQPPGWRVKLYSLNADGTWDDCGTGRIQFYFARHQHQQQHQQKPRQQPEQQQQQDPPLSQKQQQGNGGGTSSDGQAEDEISSRKEGAPLHNAPSSSSDLSSSPTTAFHELGEPMLCMRAEIPLMPVQDEEQQLQHQQNDGVSNINIDNRNTSTSPTPCQLRVLLRTRVLLHDSAYQCQGGNIITWCEPFGASQRKSQKQIDDGSEAHPSSPSSSTIVTGVDLALSFQDNAGCKDIWQNILSVQVRARELISNGDLQDEATTNSPQTQVWDANCNAATSKKSNNPHEQGVGNSDGLGAEGERAAGGDHVIGLHHHSHQPQLQQHPHHHSTSLDSPLSPKHHSPTQPQHHYHYSSHISPNSPDHDAVEDRQLGLVYSGGGHQPLALPPRPPLVVMKEAAAPAAPLSSSGGIGGGGTIHHIHTHDSVANNGNESSFSLAAHHQEDMMAVSMAAAAAAASYRAGDGSVTSGQFTGTRPASPSIEDNYTGDREGSRREASTHLSNGYHEKNRTPLHPLPQEIIQNQQQQHGQQHGFSIDIDSTLSSSSFDCNASENIKDTDKDANNLSLRLPSNNPTWNDIPSLRDYITNFQYGGGVGGFQTMNISLLQREELLMYLVSDDCSNLKKILRLFHDGGTDGGGNDDKGTNIYPGSRREEDYKLLASIIKSILLLNDPEIIEYVTTDAPAFELSCAILEYDPELRTKADHVNFIREHAKFHTVVPMDDDDCCGELVMNIHRLFRVNYLRDVILRPTMDESNLSALVSLGQFTMNDIIRGVMAVRRLPAKAVKEEAQSMENDSNDNAAIDKLSDDVALTSRGDVEENYFTRIIRVFGWETHFIRSMKWKEGHDEGREKIMIATHDDDSRFATGEEEHGNNSPDSPPASPSSNSSRSVTWQQHVAPQDASLPSRMIRRNGCLMFLNELFNMARMSLQQYEKDDFIDAALGTSITLSLEGVDVNGGNDNKETRSLPGEVHNDVHESDDGIDNIENRDPRAHLCQQISPSQGSHINLLSLLSATLADSSTDAKERGAALDILSVITMHDPSLIRKYSLDYAASTASVVADHQALHRPDPNNLQEVLFICAPDDLILSLLYVMATEVDAGLLLQASEIIRIVLDTEMVAEQFGGGPASPLGSAGGGGFLDEEFDVNVAYSSGNSGQPSVHEQGGRLGVGDAKSIESEQNSFLALFYDRYIHWLVAPFQFAILVPRSVPPTSNLLRQEFKARKSTNTRSAIGCTKDDEAPSHFCPIEPCPVRASFTLEILCFCVRAHVHRMKFFVLRSRMLSNILKVLGRHEETLVTGPRPPSGIRCLKLASLK